MIGNKKFVRLFQRDVHLDLFGDITGYPFPEGHILDSLKLKEFADDHFKFDENGGQFF